MENNTARNLFIAFMLVAFIAGWDIAHEPVPEASARVDYDSIQDSPRPISGTSNIKVSEVTIRETPQRNFVTVKVSHYWPDLGGVNCLTFKNGKCVSKMANGETWQSGVGKNVLACPKEFKFGTQIKILGKTYTCKDRGSMIVKTEDNKYWVDMLQEKALVPYGEEIKAEVL